MRKHFVLLLFSLLVLTPVTAFANGAAPIVLQEGSFNSVFIPVKNDSVSVVKEDLKYVIQGEEEGQFLADVSVNYKMFNDSDMAQNLTVVFPISAFSDEKLKFDVLFDGKKVDVQYEWIENIDTLDNQTSVDGPSFKEIIERYNFRNDKGPANNEEHNSVALAIFKLEFLPKANHELQVNYTEKPLLRTSGSYFSVRDVIYYRYYLEPAKYWKNFWSLDIAIEPPEGYKLVNCSLDVFSGGDGVYRAHFDALPDKNLMFEIRKSGFKFTFVYIILIAIVFGLVIYIAVMGKNAFKSKKRQ